MSISGDGAPQPIVVDCDPGQDDALALLLAWGSERLDLRAVTTVGGNCSARQGARNALGLRLLAGRPETPVAVGLDCDRAARRASSSSPTRLATPSPLSDRAYRSLR